jgi:phospholipid-translocating ATPase
MTVEVRAEDLRVGDIVVVSSNERVPADLVLLYTTDKSGTVFIRTDQLDGETDWKVRRPIS